MNNIESFLEEKILEKTIELAEDLFKQMDKNDLLTEQSCFINGQLIMLYSFNLFLVELLYKTRERYK